MNNIIGKSKIEYVSHGWNCYVGCNRNCKEFQCYAEKLVTGNRLKLWEKYYNAEINLIKSIFDYFENNDFIDIKNNLENFNPVFLWHKYWKDFPKKPALIFVNPLSDPEYWQEYHIRLIIEKTEQYPEHRFLFLTKNSAIYQKYNFSDNCFLGITITKMENIYELNYKSYSNPYDFLSIEPIQERIDIDEILYIPEWIICGCETGQTKNKIIPQKEWIVEIVNFCKKNNIPVFLKDNLKKYCELWGIELIQQMPAELQKIKDLWK